jgi:TRAP-type C4-dicarboxylate transport system permease small subunit
VFPGRGLLTASIGESATMPNDTQDVRSMLFGLVIAFMMIASGVFRLWLMRTGKVPPLFGVQRYFPYVFIAVGVALGVFAVIEG